MLKIMQKNPYTGTDQDIYWVITNINLDFIERRGMLVLQGYLVPDGVIKRLSPIGNAIKFGLEKDAIPPNPQSDLFPNGKPSFDAILQEVETNGLSKPDLYGMVKAYFKPLMNAEYISG